MKTVEVTEDLRYGSWEAAIAAFEKQRFRPAMRGDEAVAVWIVTKFRFVLQE